ncbi:hypothetical protein [Flavobacterium cellulosilyticum]|uniref:Uncharacterized protein n=1 Tax=Flavobacterium cellulosilyticum TaxID=2541731 RepID=A0A4R5C4T2_9FLAO|nr:hypothetical protein [Flavobacterium cellulosilyticum]TDD94721.1 hypothetical protein E0F76_15940 [Flavobacterium cellulosilyticum]
MAYLINKTILFYSLLLFISCSKSEESTVVAPPVERKVNLQHFNNLYKEMDFKGKKAAMVCIYSEFPGYLPLEDPDEGISCVDDVARAVIMLTEYVQVYGNEASSLDKIKKLTEFVLSMQNDNGYFNNFIFWDKTINTWHQNSVAQLNWWSLRALWGLETAYPLLKNDADIKLRMEQSISKLKINIKRDLPINSLNKETINNIETPTWLPQKYAADQAAILILGLLKNYERTSDSDDLLMIDALAKGIIILQKGDADHYPYNAFLSYKNQWHAYGNDQANALLKAGKVLNKKEYINSALKEVDNFYPKLLQNGFAESFFIEAVGSNFSEISRTKFPQIAYGIRPIVSASAEAYSYSKNNNHLTIAKNFAAWLSGSNEAGTAIYNHDSGICFDGIVSATQINKNSGAESTIESLLILLEMEKLKQ